MKQSGTRGVVMLFDLTSRFMPNPKVLQDAIDAGMVGVTTDVNGELYSFKALHQS